MIPPPDALPERYFSAWRRLCADLEADLAVLGATISGSVLRGLGGPTSDLDVYVLIRGVSRWRRTYVCEGVLVEEFRNPESWIRRYVERRDDAAGLHMLGHGVVVLDRDPGFQILRAEARCAYALGPRAPTQAEALYARYAIWDSWCDVKDLLARGDDDAARGLIQRETHRTIGTHHRLAARWLPKVRDTLTSLESWDPLVADELRVLWSSATGDLSHAFRAYDRLVRHTLAPHDPDAPILWTSAPEEFDGEVRSDPAPVRSAPPPAAGEYVLGANDVELARLTLQHEVWGEVTERFLDGVGVPKGGRVLDLGCGPGLVLPSLRSRVGSTGRVDALDASARWIAHVAREVAACRWTNVHPVCARLDGANLESAAYDVVFARWVVEFIPNPRDVLRQLASALRPGGVLALIDYNHEGISLFPESEGFRAVVRAMRAMWRLHGGDAFLAGRLPGLFRAAGLEPLPPSTTVLTGGPDSGVFRWADAFFPAHSENMVREGVLTADERAHFLTDWAARKADPDAVFFSPIVVGAAARKPTSPRSSAPSVSGRVP